MKRNIILMMLFAVASSMYADIVLKSDKSIRIIPNTCTTSGKTIVYSYDYSDGGFTVYTPDFLVDKIIKVPQMVHQEGTFTETATVAPTGVDIVPEDAYGSINYYTYSVGKANSQDEMIQKLQEDYNYYTVTAFTDPLGNPACYIEGYTRFMYENLFGKKYPRNWYALIDSTIYNVETYSRFYTITYNEEDAVWTRISENIETYNNYIVDVRVYYEGIEIKETYLTQNIFNNDEKWEYIFPDYGELETNYYSTNVDVSDDGIVTLERSGWISPVLLGYGVYNEDGLKLGRIPGYRIEIINGKPYIEGSFYDDSGKYYSALYSFDPNSETIDLVEMVQAKENRRLGAKRGIVTVDISAEQAGGEVVVSTPDGKVMTSKKVSEGKTQVNDKPLPPGVYVVSLLKGNHVIESEKYIVQ